MQQYRLVAAVNVPEYEDFHLEHDGDMASLIVRLTEARDTDSDCLPPLFDRDEAHDLRFVTIEALNGEVASDVEINAEYHSPTSPTCMDRNELLTAIKVHDAAQRCGLELPNEPLDDLLGRCACWAWVRDTLWSQIEADSTDENIVDFYLACSCIGGAAAACRERLGDRF